MPTTATEPDTTAPLPANPAHGPGGAGQADRQLIAFVLPSVPESVAAARFHVRAALGYFRLGDYVDDAEIIASELVTNAVQHVCADGTQTVGVILMRIGDPGAVAVVVTDSSPHGPVKCEPSDRCEHGRGLLIIDGLSVHWGWNPEDGGKAVYALLAKEAGA